MNNAVSNIVHYADPGVVSSVMVDGRFLMREGKVLVMDEAQVLAEAEIAAEQSWSRLLAENSKLKTLRT